MAEGNRELATKDDMPDSCSNEEEQAVNAPIASGSSNVLESPSMDNVVRILKPLPGFVKLTYEPCMMTSDDDPTIPRAEMPCGHVISTLAMMEYCKEMIRRGRVKFLCPGPACFREWDYSLVCHVACLTDEEMQDVEKKLTENFLYKEKGIKKCPGCQLFCYRPQGVMNCVRCQMCTTSLGRCYDFCWLCLREWQLYSSQISCGNQGCNGEDIRLVLIRICPTDTIHGIECPRFRGCPNCGRLIRHRGGCAHVECPNCPGFGFCFLCLKERENGEWKCTPWNGTCPVARRQTILTEN